MQDQCPYQSDNQLRSREMHGDGRGQMLESRVQVSPSYQSYR